MSRFKNAELEDSDCGLEELVGRIFTRIPIAKTVDHYTSAACGSIRWYRDHVVITYVPHLGRVHLLMDLRMFLFEVVVIHYLSKDCLSEINLVLCHSCENIPRFTLIRSRTDYTPINISCGLSTFIIDLNKYH